MSNENELVEVYPGLQKYLIDYENIGFSGTPFMLFGLPTRKTEVQEWIRETDNYKFVIYRDKENKHFIPYGATARMVQIFIDSEIKRTNSHIIKLGKSFSEYTEKLGYTKGWATKSIIQQTKNFASIEIRLIEKNKKRDKVFKTLTSNGWNIAQDPDNAEQQQFEEDVIILDEKYKNFVYKHAVPMDMKIIRKFKDNPTALDFIRYLAYRNNGLKKELSYPEEKLFQQLGLTDSNKRRTRGKLKKILKEVQPDWKINSGFKDKYFYVRPSEPMVAPTKLK